MLVILLARENDVVVFNTFRAERRGQLICSHLSDKYHKSRSYAYLRSYHLTDCIVYHHPFIILLYQQWKKSTFKSCSVEWPVAAPRHPFEPNITVVTVSPSPHLSRPFTFFLPPQPPPNGLVRDSKSTPKLPRHSFTLLPAFAPPSSNPTMRT